MFSSTTFQQRNLTAARDKSEQAFLRDLWDRAFEAGLRQGSALSQPFGPNEPPRQETEGAQGGTEFYTLLYHSDYKVIANRIQTLAMCYGVDLKATEVKAQAPMYVQPPGGGSWPIFTPVDPWFNEWQSYEQQPDPTVWAIGFLALGMLTLHEGAK